MNTYDRHSTLDLQSILTLIKFSNEGLISKKIVLKGQQVKLDGLRLKSFQVHGTRCSCCQMDAQFFALERHKSVAKVGGGYHLNLYGVRDSKEVLFTHDHTLARALGGTDTIENVTTMCAPCNSTKSVEESREAARRRSAAGLVELTADEVARILSIFQAKEKPTASGFSLDYGAYKVRVKLKV